MVACFNMQILQWFSQNFPSLWKFSAELSVRRLLCARILKGSSILDEKVFSHFFTFMKKWSGWRRLMPVFRIVID